jgi:acyl-CoA reductase-like NAD-dependent aldehyde dehydrogenase
MIAELFHECGAPKGLLNILHGYGAEAAAPMVEHKTVKAISFTGGICAICHFTSSIYFASAFYEFSNPSIPNSRN